MKGLQSTVYSLQKLEVRRRKTINAFTLVELLVTITIITILATLGFVSYRQVVQKAKDAQRESDLKFIQSGLEQYFADQKNYPFQIVMGTPLVFGERTYITKLPSDPAGDPNYLYEAKGSGCSSTNVKDCTSYCLFAAMEGSNPSDDVGCNPPSDYNYGLTKP